MRRIPVCLAGAVLSVLVLASCGSSSKSSSNTTTGNGSTATTAPASTATSEGTGTTLSGGGAGSAAIASVTFTGSSADPTITIAGSSLGQLPSPNPAYTPEGHPLCPLSPSGNQGYDYGTNLYLYDPARNWAGGRYRPELGELDCIGLIVQTFTPTKIVFKFGSAYAQYQKQDNYLLAEGDPYQVAANGATLQGTVHYSAG